ncbi:MAG: hypothetical protein ACTHME_00245 [Candidatus Nitrosocosmicus sp.]
MGLSILCLGWNNGSLTGYNCITKVFSHELVDVCPNPNVDSLDDEILVNGFKTNGDMNNKSEIDNSIENRFKMVYMHDISYSLQSY